MRYIYIRAQIAQKSYHDKFLAICSVFMYKIGFYYFPAELKKYVL